jgi:photosystem II stability/assembly factor-like uncharacterized protein
MRQRPLAILAAAVFAVPAWGAGIPENAYHQLRWRLLGPFRAGWALCAAGVPGDPTTFYFGAADGGVFRTRDAGITWQPLFDRYGSASVGALALAPSDAKVIWVGTGQVHQRWDIVSGDGVYRSEDGGETFTNVGLRDTRHIGRIWVDPRDAGRVLVAALGHVFGPNPERGVFRTEDGGRSWKKVLFKDADTGAVDLAADPEQPDTVYASLWQVRRHPWLDYFQPPIGPGSGIWKSDDAGRSWAPVGGRGLPQRPLGRIALAVGPGTGARRVYATIDAPEVGGLYRSDDGGASWTLANADRSLAGSYMNMVTTDPRDPDVVWVVGRSLRRSSDGGKTFTIFKGAPGGDDYHFLWIDPGEPRRMITGADQGAVVTLNGGRSWSSWYNQPTGQFYRIAADDRFPYRVYSGQQDSGTVSIPIRSNYGQITFRDWHPVGGDERDGDIPDPADPDVVYGAGLGGRLSKWDAKTGQVQNVSPWPVGTYGRRPQPGSFRYSWITPLAVSARAPHALYQGSQVLWRSLDGGKSWQTLSPDLTGARKDAPRCEGDVRVEDATACGYAVIFAIAPSPAADGVVWFGTDNGRVLLTRDDARTWRDVTPPGMGDWTKVNTIDASPGDPATAYVAADRHRLDDERPLAWRTHDFGATWTEIGRGLPSGAWLGVVRQDPKRKGLLYAGTSRGVHVSFDDGVSWQSLQLNLPTTGINDMVVKGEELAIATQGRGIWALDGVTPLRHLEAHALQSAAVFTPPAVAYRVAGSHNKDTPLPPEEPRAPNPPAGAVLDYFLPAAPAGPLTLEILGPGGEPVRRFRSDDPPERLAADAYFAELWRPAPAALPARTGHNRFVWDLRYARPRAHEYEYSIAALPGRPTPLLPQGPFVLPGTYEVRITGAGEERLTQKLTVAQDPRRRESAAELKALLDFQRQVIAALERAVGSSKPEARPVAEILTALATDLEASDAPPTQPQRELLAQCVAKLE